MSVCMDMLGAKQLSPGDIMRVTDPEHQELEMGIPVFKNDTNDGS